MSSAEWSRYLRDEFHLSLEPDEINRRETSANGIRSAHAAGMAVVAVPDRRFPPGPDALALAGAVIESLDGLVPAVMGAEQGRHQRDGGRFVCGRGV